MSTLFNLWSAAIVRIRQGTKGFFQFEILTNVLVSSFCFVWMLKSRVCGHLKCFYSLSAETVFRRQNLTSLDVRFWRLKTVPALKGLRHNGDILILLTQGIFLGWPMEVWDISTSNVQSTDIHSFRPPLCFMLFMNIIIIFMCLVVHPFQHSLRLLYLQCTAAVHWE